MNTYIDKEQENKNQSTTVTHTQKKGDDGSTSQFIDNRPEAIAQRKLQEIANNSPQTKQAAQLQSMADNHAAKQQQPIQKKGAKEEEELQVKFDPVQKKENNTGLPDNLKTGMENLSGLSLDDVKVHRNSNKPAQLQAHAYAQGTNIHLGPGQEKHLSHEAWHVVQQKQGRVKPTMQMKDKVNVNDDAGLEKEADVMGEKVQAIESNKNRNIFQNKSNTHSKPNTYLVQRKNNTDSPNNLKIGMKKLSGMSLDGLKIQGNQEKMGSLHGQVGIIQRKLTSIGEDQAGESKEVKDKIIQYNEQLADYENGGGADKLNEIAFTLKLLKDKLPENNGGLLTSIKTAQAEVVKIQKELRDQLDAEEEEEKKSAKKQQKPAKGQLIGGDKKQATASVASVALGTANTVLNPATMAATSGTTGALEAAGSMEKVIELGQEAGSALPVMAQIAAPIAGGLAGGNMLREGRKGMRARGRGKTVAKNKEGANPDTKELLDKVEKRTKRKQKNMAVAAAGDAAVVATTAMTLGSVGWAAPALAAATAARLAISLKGPIKNIVKRVKGDQGEARKLLAKELYNKVREGDQNVISVFTDKSWGLIGPKYGYTLDVWNDPKESKKKALLELIMRKLTVK